MRRNIVIIQIGSIILYSLILGICGVFGINIQNFLMYYVFIILKYIFILFGLFLCVFLPIRISNALELRKNNLENKKIDNKLDKYAEEEKKIERKIIEELNKTEQMGFPV